MDDLRGRKFGRLLTIEGYSKGANRHIVWLCKCNCGETVKVRSSSLRLGDTRSCGCLKREMASRCGKGANKGINVSNLKGQRFGRLIVLKDSGKRKSGEMCYLCGCDCGNFTEVRRGSLRRGHTRSCGCLKREKAFKHGETETRLYSIWESMKSRCNNPRATNYKYYGKRGITVCPEWNNGYLMFRDWALANGYADNLTIDRIDNDSNYSPSNCEWITRSENTKKRNDLFKD